MTNEEKAQEISLQWWSECGWQLQAAAYDSALEAMQWKDEQHKQDCNTFTNYLKEWAQGWLIEQLTAFAVHLNKRGAFCDDLCMDFEHEAQSFIEMQNNKEI